LKAGSRDGRDALGRVREESYTEQKQAEYTKAREDFKRLSLGRVIRKTKLLSLN
jgi:hypothetical protein